jgi:hypothetical protein
MLGIFTVLVPDSMSPIIADADPVNPTFTVGWLDYAQARGFGTDPAPLAEGQASGGTGGAVRARQLLRRRGLR